MGDPGLHQQGAPSRGQFGHRPPPVILAGNAVDQATPFQAFDGPGETTGTEPDHASQPGHALGTSGMGQCAQQLEFPEWQAVRRLQLGIEPVRNEEVRLAQATPNGLISSRCIPVRLRFSSRIHISNYSRSCLRTQLPIRAAAGSILRGEPGSSVDDA